MQTTIAILGDGAWGTAIAVCLAKKPEYSIRLWSARPDNARILREQRENVKLLPGVAIPSEIQLTEDPAEAIRGADLWISAIPTVYLRNTLARFREWASREIPVVSLTKGLEQQTFRRPSEIIAEVLGSDAVVVLSGPSHAEEVARGMPTSVVVAGQEGGVTSQVQKVFASDRFRVYTNSDPLGVELAGALKNVIAIAAGICDGLGYGDNAKAALLTRGLVEMAKFGVSLGAEHATFQGLAGMGDLITTCFSPHGRNRRVGERLGKGEKLAAILHDMVMIAEGVTTAKSVRERSERMGLDLPIMTGVYQVLYEGVSPPKVVTALMSREQRSERPGA